MTASSQVYRPIAARTLTAHLDARLLSGEITGPFYDGYYRFKNNGVVFGTVGLDIFNEASIRVPTDLAPGTNDFTAEFVPTGDRLPSASAPLRYRTALVTPTVAVSARGVTLSAADQKRFGVTSGLIVTSTVKAPGSSYVPTGKVHVNIRGKVTTVTLSGGRGVSPVIPAAKGAVTIYSTFEPTSDPTLAIRALGRVNATVVR